jgi:hypothetical protein
LSRPTEFYGKWIVGSNQNTTKKSKIYLPSLSIFKKKDGSCPMLQIKYSLPKIFYGNNLLELTQDNFDCFIAKLKNVLEECSVCISDMVLRNATVAKIDFSKNVFIDKRIVLTKLFCLLARNDIGNSRLKELKINYQNIGSKISFGCKSYEIVLIR